MVQTLCTEAFALVERALDGRCEAVHITGLEVIPGLAVVDGVRECTAVDGDDRRSAGERLQRYQPLCLDGTREQERVEAGVKGRKLLPVEEAEEARVDVPGACGGLNTLPCGAVAAEDDRHLPVKARTGDDDLRKRFLVAVSACIAHQRPVLGQAVAPTKRRGIHRLETVDVDAVGDDPRVGDAEFVLDVLPRRLGGDDHRVGLIEEPRLVPTAECRGSFPNWAPGREIAGVLGGRRVVGRN